MMKGSLICQRFSEAHNVTVACWLDGWGLLSGSDSSTGGELFDAYKNFKKKKRDFFWMHWQVNIPEYPWDIRLHVESPPHSGSPELNTIKRDVVMALRAAGISNLAGRQHYQYDDTSGKTSYEQMRQFKSTEAFRIVLIPDQRKVTHEGDIEQVHMVFGSTADKVLLEYANRLNHHFRF